MLPDAGNNVWFAVATYLFTVLVVDPPPPPPEEAKVILSQLAFVVIVMLLPATRVNVSVALSATTSL